MITINISEQSLEYKGKSYSISTAINGTGEIEGSYCTPTGKFKIAEKIGANLELGSVLVEREPTGEIYNTDLAKKNPDRDWILTRILWLDGIEEHNQNTKNRYIYIHGSPDEIQMGMAGSKGCIRMHNYDVIELFESTQSGENIIIIK
tara:strand:- start:560 stop:1003 length:444 start_codon:yes stop_codon:yes gene_type:complete